MASLQRVLIANRGEIAKRLIEHYAAQGVESVVAFSEPDAEQGYLDDADYAVYLNGRTVRETYMHPSRVVSAAMDAGCEAIHPGYCFLAEHLEFYQTALAANMAIIGADPRVLPSAVDRFHVRRLAREHGIPVIPASEPIPEGEDGIEAAANIGMPLFVKAVHGGAMCRVDDYTALADALTTTRAAAEIAAGSRAVYLEAVVDAQRQVGTVVIADRHGCRVQLGHADGSLELSYTSWVEELGEAVAPELGDALGPASRQLAAALGWVGVGKVRWAVTPDGGWYLLGFSARLTTGYDLVEAVHGIDLLQAQYEALAGGSLDWDQADAVPGVHGLQIRILHVDPGDDTRPEGTLERLELPEGVICRTGVDLGTACSADTDPLLAKLTITAPTRGAAVVRARAALDETVVDGVPTNLGLLRDVFSTEAFWRGEHDVRTLRALLRAG